MWTVEFLVPAAEERAALPSDMRARLARVADAIERHGVFDLPRDWIKPLEGKLWEIRITGRDGIARAIYILASKQRVVVLRIFIKKTQKTPRREIELAHARAKDIT